ncbi:hypothetical protein SSX86_004324 [Deinandra increscens subsp. villosa]|uniref:F-box domain-containing protein n=1 Tax=Deinandra increscens subsp. villosa TaxID=3103831 RepID=A0AAP0DJC9_9ASTR
MKRCWSKKEGMSGRYRMRMDGEVDRLSGLQDDIVLKILSFVGLKDAIGTSLLSSRWRFIWTSIPHLDFSTKDFSTMDKFSDFVTHVLSRRDNQVRLSSLKLYIHGKDGQDLARRIVNYAISLNVQQLNVTCLFENDTNFFEDGIGFPLSLPSSHTLKHLTLSGSFHYDHFKLTSTPKLSSLTTLHLDCITFYDGFFSMCPNLENLTLNQCKMMGLEVLRISHPRLSNLTLDNGYTDLESVNVVTPQLKHLTILGFSGTYLISAPELASFFIRGYSHYTFSTDGFRYLEKAQLSLRIICRSHVPKILSLLQKLHNVKHLSLCMEIIKFLNLSMRVISHQPSPFGNLKSVKIFPKYSCSWTQEYTKVIVSPEVKNYLLNSSPKATLTEVLLEQ